MTEIGKNLACDGLCARRFAEGEEIPDAARESRGIRQRQVEAFIESGDAAWEIDMRGVKFPDRVHTALRGAIRSLGASGVYPQIRGKKVYLMKGEPDYAADARRRRL